MSAFWVIAGLIVIFRIGIDEIIASMHIDAMLTGNSEDADNPYIFVATMFFMVMFWPVIWLLYQDTMNEK